MYTESEQALLKTILKAIYDRHTLDLEYLAPRDGAVLARVVEPYAVAENDGSAMLRAFQLEPQAGWRFFDLRLISAVRDAGRPFAPRRILTIQAGETQERTGPVVGKNRERAEYKRRVLEVIADLEVSPDELKGLMAFRGKLGITPDEVRGVHFRVLNECLSTLVQDELITEEEVTLLGELSRCLNACLTGKS